MRQCILVQLPSYDAGGAENYALRLIRHGGSDDYDWHVTTSNLRHATLENAFRRAGAQVHHAGPGYGQPGHVLSFHRFLRHYRFDAVMTLTGVFGGLGLSIARLAGVPRRIAWHRRSTPAYALTRGRRLYARQSLALLHWGTTRILSNSRAALDRFHGKNWARSTKFGVIPNGIDARRFRSQPSLGVKLRAELGIPAAARVIGHVGRVDPAKDHDTLIAVAAKLRPKFADLRLLMAGTGTDSLEFEKRLERAGVRDIAVPLGVRADVERLYQVMNVFVFPSVTEGQPNALIEAMLCGVPAVASNIPGTREAVPPALWPRLFTPRDVSDASMKVEAVLSDQGSVVQSQLEWLRERYDLSRNLDMALRELDPPMMGVTAHA
jgi:glycosyltransferase involved in cell wall biosynthesis